MKLRVVATASVLAAVPMLASGASATATHGGSWTFTDYTPDPATLAAAQMLHTTTGKVATSYCGSRVPSAPQDVNAHRLTVRTPSVLRLRLSSTGAWGAEVDNLRGTALAAVATGNAPTTDLGLKVRLRPGIYSVSACNLGGAPSARADYQLLPTR